MIKRTLTVAVVLLSACEQPTSQANTSIVQKPGGTPVEKEIDAARCQAEAVRQVPYTSQPVAAQPILLTGGVASPYAPPPSVTSSYATGYLQGAAIRSIHEQQNLRFRLMRACMLEKGYREIVLVTE